MAIQTTRVKTSMGKITPWGGQLDYLSDDEKKELDIIGYTGKNSVGEKTNWSQYLNSLGKGEFEVEKIKFDTGDFIEEFMVIRVYKQ